VTIYGELLARGYFPKELPPAFFTDDFSSYARTIAGRAALKAYKPTSNLTELVAYRLARPSQSGLEIRPLSIPHPATFAALTDVVAKNFRRLLRKAGMSKLSRSRPVYSVGQPRAIRTLVKPTNLAREKSNVRGGATHLLKVDISQFYPSLYTHAVGWAIDPQLRQRKNWANSSFLGKQIDQLLMNMQGKVSQGIPIGNDLSFLLAEIVLGQVDRALKVDNENGYRWFDDYEFACTSRAEAEDILRRLNRALESFRLRVNPKKTRIVDLPCPVGDGWQDDLRQESKTAMSSAASMVSFFDNAFRLRAVYFDDPVLMYAMGTLFKVRPPRADVRRVAESCITQAVLSEPGCAQKAFALLAFWELNGASFDRSLLSATIDKLVEIHEYRGVSSDVAWALAFSIEHSVKLSKKAGKNLSRVEDDAVAIQALHANSLGLAPAFSTKAITADLRTASCDGDHWLLLYESVRQGFIPALAPVVAANALFADMLAKGVSFYRSALPAYATLVHPGGAPEWVIRAWLDAKSRATAIGVAEQLVTKMIDTDLESLDREDKTVSELAQALIDRLTEHPILAWELYE
jgi:hypothetical protein